MLELRTARKRVVNRMPNDKVSAETGTAAGFERVSGIVYAEGPGGRVEAPTERRMRKAELGHVAKVAVPFLARRGIQPIPGTDPKRLSRGANGPLHRGKIQHKTW